MQLRKSVFALGLVAALAFSVFASDAWKTKPYEKWTAQEVEKILTDSPWAKAILLPNYPYLNGDSRETDKEIKIGKANDPVEDPLAVPSAHTRIFKPEGTFILRWNSSRTLRRALYRDAVLHGLPADFAQHYMIDTPDHLQLVLIAVGQTTLPPVEESTLLKATFIQLQPSGEKIYTNHVRVRDSVDAAGDEAYVFDFPVNLGKSSPPLLQNATLVEFFTQVGVRKFNAKFHPAEMVNREGADFF
jgi:hypothetical protein